MVHSDMDSTSPDRQVFLLCDSWYPEGYVAGLVDECQNPDIICNARIDTVMYDLPPEHTSKQGRPKKHGKRLSPEDSEPESPRTGDWKIGVHLALNRLQGGQQVVYAIATLSKSENENHSFFLYTKNPEIIIIDYAAAKTKPSAAMGKKTKNSSQPPVIPHAGTLKYHAMKARLLGTGGIPCAQLWVIERLVNLKCTAYSAMIRLPYSDKSFLCYQSASAQESRFSIGQQFRANPIFSSFVESPGTYKSAVIYI